MSRKKTILLFVISLAGAIQGIVSRLAKNKAIYGSKEVQIQETGINEIKIRTSNQEIMVLPSFEPGIKAELTGPGSKLQKEPQLITQINGSALIVQAHYGRRFKPFNQAGKHHILYVYLPRKPFSLTMETENGDIHAEHVQLNKVIARGEDCHITMKNIPTAIWTDVKLDSGKLSFIHVSGEIHGEMDNGQINLKTSGLDYPVTLKCDNGSIKMKTGNKPLNAVFDVEIDNGHSHIFGESSVKKVVGDGKHPISLQIDNGSVKVEH